MPQLERTACHSIIIIMLLVTYIRIIVGISHSWMMISVPTPPPPYTTQPPTPTPRPSAAGAACRAAWREIDDESIPTKTTRPHRQPPSSSPALAVINALITITCVCVKTNFIIYRLCGARRHTCSVVRVARPLADRRRTIGSTVQYSRAIPLALLRYLPLPTMYC